MFCSNCGAQVNDQARFCRNCGTPVSNPSYTQPVPPAAPSEPPRTEPVKKDKYGRFSRERVIASGVLGIFFGYLGVHNFLMKQPVRGVLHILLIIVPFLPIALLFIDILSSGGISDLGIDFMPLYDFLCHHYTEQDFISNHQLLDRFALLDDGDIVMALKCWMSHPDTVLRTLSEHLLNRHLSAIRVSDRPFDPAMLDTLRTQAQLLYGIGPEESEFFVGTGKLHNHAYDYNDKEIKVLFKDGTCRDIGDASDQLDRHFLEKQVTKYYIYYPKSLR